MSNDDDKLMDKALDGDEKSMREVLKRKHKVRESAPQHTNVKHFKGSNHRDPKLWKKRKHK